MNRDQIAFTDLLEQGFLYRAKQSKIYFFLQSICGDLRSTNKWDTKAYF